MPGSNTSVSVRGYDRKPAWYSSSASFISRSPGLRRRVTRAGRSARAGAAHAAPLARAGRQRCAAVHGVWQHVHVQVPAIGRSHAPSHARRLPRIGRAPHPAPAAVGLPLKHAPGRRRYWVPRFWNSSVDSGDGAWRRRCWPRTWGAVCVYVARGEGARHCVCWGGGDASGRLGCLHATQAPPACVEAVGGCCRPGAQGAARTSVTVAVGASVQASYSTAAASRSNRRPRSHLNSHEAAWGARARGPQLWAGSGAQQ